MLATKVHHVVGHRRFLRLVTKPYRRSAMTTAPWDIDLNQDASLGHVHSTYSMHGPLFL
jgi:hypothetical protein